MVYNRRKFCKDQEVIEKGSGGYTTRIRSIYSKDQEVMYSNRIIEPLQNFLANKGCKITAHKKVCFSENLALLTGFFGSGATISIG